MPFLKPEYFLDPNDKLLYQTISDFLDKYNTAPTIDALEAEIESLSITEDTLKAIKYSVDEIQKDTTITSYDWLLDATEEFCQEKAIYNAIMGSIEIMNGKGGQNKGAIPDLLTKALGVSFDPNVGHDFLEDYRERFEYYHAVEEKIPFDLDYFNRITNGGVSKGTLNIILAGTGVGKSLAMSHFAAACLNAGKNVLYITLELSEKEVAKRIDANLMDTPIKDLMVMPQNVYEQKASSLKHAINGKLLIKQYPPAAASSIHFRALLNELNLKKNFRPDIIFVDYLNLCVSSRIKRANSNSYEYIKSIAEEIRGLAVEFCVPIFSATQVNRQGFVSTDIGLEDTSESFGLPATADFMFAMIASEELNRLNQIMIKQLKNRYNDIETNKRFIIGIDRFKMRLYDVDEKEQQNIVDTNNTPAQQKPKTNPYKTNNFTSNKQRFQELKVS